MAEPLATGDWQPPPGPSAADRPTVPGYEILEELGRGGMGVVYKARQVNLKRLVALKVIREGALAGPQELARFRIESEAVARMRHPNIVQIYEAGEHLGRPYFVMELLEGGSLDQHLAGRPLSAGQAAALVRTLALAVQHAHARQVVHRDLKPANILLADGPVLPASAAGDTEVRQSEIRNPQSAIKISDFGLAKRLDRDSTAATVDGAVLGTASYMAPEQAAGRAREVGPPADVYALGAILYECLTGRPPFQGDSWNRTVEQVLHDEPTPPTRSHPDVPPDLETVCLKCLEKEPARRYPRAEQLADDLGRFLAGQPVAAVPPGEGERLARLAARDGYQVLDEIGRGPQGTVYRALSGALRHAVALKVFAAGSCPREEWDGRLRRASELWSGLAHPHIVSVQRAGWWDGSPYLAVEYVPQGSLAARITGRPWPLEQALRLVEQLVDVVRYLHRQGVVHGNLKPTNVLLAADGIPRVVDFLLPGGRFGAAPADDTAPGLGYLAPELVRDPGAEPRPHTDVYGLGVILYELLAGRPPFAGATARETLAQVASQDPAPPSRLNPAVSPSLDAVCLRCLRKDPWQRYHRAYDLLIRLQDLREDTEGPDKPGGCGRPRRRRPT